MANNPKENADRPAVSIGRPAVVHTLKTWPAYFKALANGTKTFDIRKDDRDYRVGDTLQLREYDQHADAYTGREVVCTVIYLQYLFVAVGYVALGVSK